MKRKESKRVDKLISILLKISAFEWMIAKIVCLNTIRKRHTTSLKYLQGGYKRWNGIAE